jgi:protein gp37
MSDHSSIEWTDATWSPTLGCLKVSAGCEHCYAIRNAYRQEHFFKRPDYQGLTRKLPDGSLNWTGTVRMLPERLRLPLSWTKPRRIFVDSMSDLFHDQVPDDFIDQVFATMAWSARHTYQILTKRPERMLRYLTTPDRLTLIENARCDTCVRSGGLCGYPGDDCGLLADTVLALPNVWLGVSVENQATADERIPLLLQTPAAVRFLSCEPLLGPVDLAHVIDPHWPDALNVNAFRGIDWVIAGGESGPDFRPMDLDWARSLRDQCQAAGVAFHFKQHGGRTHGAGGRLLDGRTWDEYPGPQTELAHA